MVAGWIISFMVGIGVIAGVTYMEGSIFLAAPIGFVAFMVFFLLFRIWMISDELRHYKKDQAEVLRAYKDEIILMKKSSLAMIKIMMEEAFSLSNLEVINHCYVLARNLGVNFQLNDKQKAELKSMIEERQKLRGDTGCKPAEPRPPEGKTLTQQAEELGKTKLTLEDLLIAVWEKWYPTGTTEEFEQILKTNSGREDIEVFYQKKYECLMVKISGQVFLVPSGEQLNIMCQLFESDNGKDTGRIKRLLKPAHYTVYTDTEKRYVPGLVQLY